MGLVIRCMYNNQGWKAACLEPGEDWECKMCFVSLVNIRPPKEDDKVCSGYCWERYICQKYRWGCTPKGRTFAQAHKGMEVFFVYKHLLADDYTIWATTKVTDVDTSPMQTGKDFEDGYAFIHFEPFDQLPRAQWVSGLTAQQLVGNEWRQGRFRYIGKDREQYLEQLIQGKRAGENAIAQSPIEPNKSSITGVELMPNIRKRLDQIAQNEGRTIEEIIREAIAEWLRARDS
jgi:hypothetical protein